MGLKSKIVVWFLSKKLKGSVMLKWLRKYPVLVGVAIVCLGTILEFFGAGGWAQVLLSLASGAGLTLDAVNAPVSAVEVTGAIAGLLGVVTKVTRDYQKRKAAKK